MIGLTKRQREIFIFIQTFIASKNYSPSYREIMEYFGFSSPATVYQHIHVLKRKGMLKTEKNCSRSTFPFLNKKSEEEPQEVEIPFIGYLTGKKPIENFPNSQTIKLPKSFVQSSVEKSFVLKVRGDSLNEELIADGDLLLLETRQEVYNGETVLVLINQNESYIKKYHNDSGQQIRLESYLSHHQPIFLKSEHLNILGVLAGLFRFF